MNCDFVIVNGTKMIICGARRAKPKQCHNCGRSADLLCDYKISPGKTCSRPMCGVCSVPMGENLDYCRSHHAVYQAQRTLF